MPDNEMINHQAYMDVLNCKEPSSTDTYYMQCYSFWLSCDPGRFDPLGLDFDCDIEWCV